MSVQILRDEMEPLIPGMVKAQPILNRYEIPYDIEQHIRSLPYHFGYSGFSEAVYYRTYSQTKLDGTKEDFPDTIIRVIKGIISIAKDYRIKHGLEWNENFWNNIALRFGIALMNMWILPPGRGLWISGTEYSYQRGSVAFNNCGFCSLNEGIIKAACWTMDSLMCGCGIGFDTDSTDEFNRMIIPDENKDKIRYIIHDSREGWVKSLYLLLSSYFDGKYVEFDYSELRNEGVPIRGFGGESSGPEPLRILHERIRLFIECYIAVRDGAHPYTAIYEMTTKHIAIYPISNTVERPSLEWALSELHKSSQFCGKTYGKSRLICDIFNAIGICVVAGNVRRSSEIALGSATDEEFRNLKNVSLNPERCIISWMSNNTVCLDKTEDFEMLPQIAARIKDNGEPGIFNRLNAKRFGRIGKREPIGREAEEDKACVTADTLIMTTQGLKRVDELIGVKFTTIVFGQEYLSDERGFWCNGNKETFIVILENGMRVILTNDHQIYVHDGRQYKWLPVSKINNELVVLSSNSNLSNFFIEQFRKKIKNIIQNSVQNGSKFIIQRSDNNLDVLQIELMSYLGINSFLSSEMTYLTVSIEEFKSKINGNNNFEIILSRVRDIVKYENENVYDCSIPEENWFSGNGIVLHNCGVNPCSEIPLESYEYCNLAEIFPTRCNNFEEMKEAAYLATLYASTVSLLTTHWSYSNAVIARNRRIGVSISGITEQIAKTSVTDFTKICRALYKIVRKTNKELADECGVPESIRVTTVKPSGTISQLVGVSSGVHHNTYRYCIRRMRIGKTSKLVDILKRAGYSYEIDKKAGEGTLIFSFPLFQGEARSAEEVSVWEQANNLALLQREWADNCVSCTLYFKPDQNNGNLIEEKLAKIEELSKTGIELTDILDVIKECKPIVDKIKKNQAIEEGTNLEHVLAHFAPIVKSLSALPHTEEGVYEQAPYESITEEKYYELIQNIKPLNMSGFDEDAIGTRGCDGDKCDLRSYLLGK